MSQRGEDRGGGARRLSGLRRIGRAAFSPWRLLRIEESVAGIRRDFHDLSAGGQAGASRMKLDETGVFDLDATSVLHGQRRAAFEDAAASARDDLSIGSSGSTRAPTSTRPSEPRKPRLEVRCASERA